MSHSAPHPVEPEPLATPPAPGQQPNPTHLPVEPEFGPQPAPARPEEPGPQPTQI